MIELKSARTPTIGDRIRAASDEELAELLFEVDFREGNTGLYRWLDWLHQPAEGMSARGHENIGEDNT